MSLTTTPKMLRTQFENMVEDTHDTAHTYQLLTQAKNEIETVYKLAILQAYDGSQTAEVGDTYLSLKSVPSDFKLLTKLTLSKSGSPAAIPYFPINMNRREAMQRMARRYYIDFKKAVQGLPCLGLTGSVASSHTINMYYQVKTEDLTESNENTAGIVLWPDEFQPIIVYRAAEIFQGNIDTDDISFVMSPKQKKVYEELLDAFIGWDQDIKLSQMNNQLGYADDVSDIEMPFDLGSL